MSQLDIECAIRSEVNVVISGGDSVARSSVARLIHERSRGHQEFMALGGEAVQRGRPALEMAASTGRTLFIEELAALDQAAQAELMQLLDRDAPLVASGVRDTRIIAGTAHALNGRESSVLFNSELFYRLNVIHIVLDDERLPGKPRSIH